jgi:ADP-dependent NAD(P)H-hydrate dehydratase
MSDDLKLPQLPPRENESHKGDYGRALLIGGSRGMAGAISLSGMAALRSGAGLVKLAVPEVCLDTVARFEPSYMTIPLPCDSAGRLALAARDVLTEQIPAVTALACGPGLGRSKDLDELVAWLYSTVKQPMVFDADALNALASQPSILDSPGGPRVFTPHPGEFARLLGIARVEPEDRGKLARELAGRTGGVVLVKGHETAITDGRQLAYNTTGNPGMATGGSGDVLTGVITAFLCQGLSPFDAARLGAHVHGDAGDYAAAEIGMVGMIARDLLRRLPRAIRMVREMEIPF